MNSAWHTFDAMRNAVVEGSKLRQEFDTLKAQVEKMQAELNKNTQYAKSLEESLASMRTARDNAVTESATLRNATREKDSQIAHLTSENSHLQQQLQAAQDNVHRLTQERDEAIHSSLEWEEKANSFRAVVDGIREKLSALGMSLPVHTPKDEVQPEPATPEVAPVPEVAAPVPPHGDYQSSMGTGSSQDGGGGGVDSEGRPVQPRDPATQQWRSPYNEI